MRLPHLYDWNSHTETRAYLLRDDLSSREELFGVVFPITKIKRSNSCLILIMAYDS